MARTRLNNLLIWEATASGGSPVCIADETDNLDSLSVNLYQNAEGAVLGVEIWQYDEDGDMSLLSVEGFIPYDGVRQLLNPNDPESDIWFPADQVVDEYNARFVDGEN